LIKAEIHQGDRGLEVHRLRKLLHRAFKTKALQGEAGGLLGYPKKFSGLGIGLKKVLTHAHVLGPLPGEEKC
jgi:hypothetical protein